MTFGDISMLSTGFGKLKELGYPTQKPEELLVQD